MSKEEDSLAQKCVIYPYEDHVAVLGPTYEKFDAMQTALRDVPKGLPFLILTKDDLPGDEYLDLFNSFTADFSNPDGYGMGTEEFDTWYEQQQENT